MYQLDRHNYAIEQLYYFLKSILTEIILLNTLAINVLGYINQNWYQTINIESLKVKF